MKNQQPPVRFNITRGGRLDPLLYALFLALLLLGQPAAVFNASAGWTPPQGSVPPPTVLTIYPWEVEPPAADGMVPASNPMAQLVLGPDGALYGMMTRGGNVTSNPWGHGTLFKLQPDGLFTELHVFNGSDGSCSYQDTGVFGLPTWNVPPLVVGPDGALYGCTMQGGALGAGTIFKLRTDGTFTKLHDFQGGEDGGYPDTGLVLGPDGALYGTTVFGGMIAIGNVFKVETNGTITSLHSFSDEDGGLFNVNWDGQTYADSALVVGPDGALYGTTTSGGVGGGGTLFKLQLDGTFTRLHDFNVGSSKSALVVGSDGDLYGSVYSDTGNYCFRVTTSGAFTPLNGLPGGPAVPPAMVSGPDGALYGSSGQTLFRLKTSGDFTILHTFTDAVVVAPLVVGPGGAMYGGAEQGAFFKLETNGNFTTLHDFRSDGGSGTPRGLVLGPDGALYGAGDTLFKLVLPTTRPLVQGLSPSQATAGSGDVSVTINGVGFLSGARVFFDSVEVVVTYLGTTQLHAVVPASALPSPIDFAIVQITVLNPGSTASKPVAFTVIGTGVSSAVGQVQSSVASVGETVSVQTPPSAPDSAGVTASLENSTGTTPATVTAATYTENPTPAAAFEAGGGFVDLQVSGADPGDRLSSSFYYPQTVTGAAEAGLTLKFFNGTAWIDVMSSGGVAPAKNTTDNLDGTVSGGRFQVVFDNTSTPQITELNGTVFAVAIPDTTRPTVTCPNITVPANVNLLVPVIYPAPTVSDNIDPAPHRTYSIPSGSGFKVGTTTVTCTATDAAGNTGSTTFTVTRAALGFTGFLSPIGGEAAKGTGGTFADPLRAFKLGSTIPVKFASSCSGSPIATGLHTLQAAKYSNSVDSDPVIDATPMDSATTGNQFRLTDAASGEWRFNLNTKPLSVGTWKLTATLSDGTIHEAWVTIKK